MLVLGPKIPEMAPEMPMTSSPLCALVSKQSQSLAKYPTINFTGISSNNMDKFIDYKILTNTLIY